MIKNFHFKILIALSVQAFVLSFMFLSSARDSSTNQIGVPLGLVFTMIAGVAASTALAIRSINRRLDAAGVAEDPEPAPPKRHQTTQDVTGSAVESKSPVSDL